MANFRHTMHIRKRLSQYNGTDTELQPLSLFVAKKLKVIFGKEMRLLESYTDDKISESQELSTIEYIVKHQLEELIETFENLNQAITDDEDPNEYGCESYEEWFDYALQELYDIGDTITHESSNTIRNRYICVA